jgi:hypothetical protein
MSWIVRVRVQVTMAVVVCCVAHVLHAVYTPWGAHSVTYLVQHLSLLATTYVFVIGLLLKVGRRPAMGTPCVDVR